MSRGAYAFAPIGPVLSPEEHAFFREADPWGFILFQRNCETPDQLRRLTRDLREAVGWRAPILIDQEGGRVQRMRAPHWREFLPPLDQVELFDDAEQAGRAMFLRGALIGAELLEHGIDVNCAPSCDIAYPDTHPFLRNRCYGADVVTVSSMARACAEGHHAAGCLTVIKHAPGHGRAVVDSHKNLPTIDVPLAELRQTDFAPFRELADTGMAMTAHIVVPEIDADRPVTQSDEGIRFLREELGLFGLLMSDDISMNALEGDVALRASRAVAAGCDLVLHRNGKIDEMERISGTVGTMDVAAAKRADIALTRRGTTRDIDIPALEAEFDTLIRDAANARR